MLGTIYLAKENVDEAIKEFTEVLRLNPRATAAQIQLSSLQMLKGSPAPSAVQFAQQATATRSRTTRTSARLMLVRTLLNRQPGQPGARRVRTEGSCSSSYPQAAPVVSQRRFASVAEERQGGRAQVVREGRLARSGTRSSRSSASSRSTSRRTRLPDARGRVEARLARRPNQPDVLILAARTYATLGDGQ